MWEFLFSADFLLFCLVSKFQLFLLFSAYFLAFYPDFTVVVFIFCMWSPTPLTLYIIQRNMYKIHLQFTFGYITRYLWWTQVVCSEYVNGYKMLILHFRFLSTKMDRFTKTIVVKAQNPLALSKYFAPWPIRMVCTSLPIICDICVTVMEI